jgi:hypothetical protein
MALKIISEKIKETKSLVVHVEMENCCRFSFGCCENEMWIHSGGRKSYTYRML